MPVTSRGVFYPGPDDNWDIIVDLAAMADSIGTGSIGRGSHFFTGTSAQRSSYTSSASEGDAWQDTTGEKRMWVMKSGSWAGVFPDTGWLLDAGITAAPNWEFTQIRMRKQGDVCNIGLEFRKTGGDPITVPPSGNLTPNVLIGTLENENFIPNYGYIANLSSGYSGRTASGYVGVASGGIYLTSVSGTNNIVTGNVLSLGGTYLI